MNSQVRIRRSRGAVCGAALILLGLWGGLAPFVGPYFHFGFTPDKAWGYNTGRLYLSAVPGAAAVLGGVAVILTRSRIVGFTGSLLAALGGGWLIVGSGVTTNLLKITSIKAGTPLSHSGSGVATPAYAYAEQLALFAGIGALIVFTAALACGRMSMLSARDAADAAEAGYYPDYEAAAAAGQPEPAGTGQFPTVTRYPDSATDPFPEPSTGQFPTATGTFPPASQSGQSFTPSSSSSLTPSNPPFPDAPFPRPPEPTTP